MRDLRRGEMWLLAISACW